MSSADDIDRILAHVESENPEGFSADAALEAVLDEEGVSDEGENGPAARSFARDAVNALLRDEGAMPNAALYGVEPDAPSLALVERFVEAWVARYGRRPYSHVNLTDETFRE